MSDTRTAFTTVSLTEITCSGCGLLWAVNSAWLNARRNDGNTFYCPNGCPRAYHETEAMRLKKELCEAKCAALKQQQLREDSDRKAMAAVAERTRVEKQLRRVHRGACPCCKRVFSNLARHMENKHADKPFVFVTPKLSAIEKAKSKGFKTT